jgi:hypothetical protein
MKNPEWLRRQLVQAVDDASARLARGDWTGANAAALVGLYAVMHREQFGALPEVDWRGAVDGVAALLRCFDSSAAFVEFVRWTWNRERSAPPASWSEQFSRALVNAYQAGPTLAVAGRAR